MLRALVVDDDAHSLTAMSELVQAEGFEVMTAPNLAEARAHLEKQLPDVVLSDLMLPDGRGTELLRELLEEPTIEVILVTGKATVETAVEALRLGAYDYLTKPIDLGRLKTLLARVKDTRELKQEVSSLRAELRQLGRFGPMVGTSPAMQQVYDLIDKVAPHRGDLLPGRRERHRQGARGADRAPPVGGAKAPSCRSTAAPSRRR